MTEFEKLLEKFQDDCDFTKWDRGATKAALIAYVAAKDEELRKRGLDLIQARADLSAEIAETARLANENFRRVLKLEQENAELRGEIHRVNRLLEKQFDV